MRTRTTKSVLLALAFAVFTPRANAQAWASGGYRYDGAGNIVSIGDRAYGYDAAGRLTKAQVGATYEYEYDAYGNRTAYVVNQQRVTVPVVSATNHLADAAYDAAGNQRSRGATAATFDGFGMMTSHRFDAVNAESFVYTAHDERIGVLRGTEWTWSLRDPSGRVLRQYRSSATQPGAPWLWVADFVYRGSLLLGSEHAPSEGGRRHHHLDHLGSPRLVTSDAGSTISEHDFLPFGEERTPVGQQLAKGFDRTGHERDFDTPAPSATSAYVDSMHARYYAAKTGRFLSVDPAMDVERNRHTPQRWNRYVYAVNNPLKYADPDGRTERTGWQAGVVMNQSNQVIWIAADRKNATIVIPLRPGEVSTAFLRDTDAVIIGPDQAIEGESSGAFKIGSSDVDVEGDRADKLELATDGEWILNKAADRAGHVAPATARHSGWVIPAGARGTRAAEKKRQQLQQERQREEQKNNPPATSTAEKST